MFNLMFSDGPFRIDQTFTMPSGSFKVIEGMDIGEMLVISPTMFESKQEGDVESVPLRVSPNSSSKKEQAESSQQ